MLGNSITNGCEWHELLGRPNVKNRGISGDITDGVLARLKPVTDGKPAKIFLMIGINDLSRNVPADTVARNIFEIADYIHSNSPRTQLFVQSVLPVNEAFGRYKGIVGKDQDVVDLNRLLKAGNKAHEYQYIDLYSLFINADGRLDSRFTNDGLHLTADGYKLWRVVLEPYLNR
jgi:lysophospholipase L1-like esterase